MYNCNKYYDRNKLSALKLLEKYQHLKNITYIGKDCNLYPLKGCDICNEKQVGIYKGRLLCFIHR